MVDKAELERKELNKKLIRRTVLNQMKNDEEYKFVVYSKRRFLEILNKKRDRN